jgi:Mg/Co/Ni transporter MgtE
MIHHTWTENKAVKLVKCVHTDAQKYTVENVLEIGKEYEVKNESEDYYFVIDESGKMGGFYKEYFEEIK